MATVTELVTKFSFQGSLTPLKDFNNSLMKGIGFVGGFSAAAVGATFALGKWTSGILSSQEAIARLSQDTEVSLGFIQEMGFAATQTGSSTQALENTIDSLSKKLGQAAISGSADFSRLGISIRNSMGELKTADEILEDVSDRFQTMNLSLQQQRTLASSLGIDPSLIRLLRLSRSELTALRQESQRYGLLTEDQAGKAIEYNKAISTLRFSFDGLKRSIALGAAPALQELSMSVSNFIAENSEQMSGIISVFATGLSGMLDVLGPILPALTGITAGVGALGLAMKFAFAPLGKYSLLLTTLFFLLEDIVAFYRGYDSFTGLLAPERGASADALFPEEGEVFKEGEGFWSRFWKSLQITSDEVTGTAGLTPGGTASFGGARTVNQDVNIDVRSTDPNQAAQAISERLQEQLEDAEFQASGGGR